MKRMVLFILTAVFITVAASCAAGENVHYHLSADLSINNTVYPLSADLSCDGQKDGLQIVSDAFPGICFISERNISGFSKDIYPILSGFASSNPQKQLQWLFQNLSQAFGSDTCTGLFAGDSFSGATVSETISFSIYEFGFWIMTQADSLPEMPDLNFLFSTYAGRMLSDLKGANYQCRFISFDGGKYYSIAVCDRQYPLITCSVNCDDPEQTVFILGYGLDTKNYYEHWTITGTANGSSAYILLYADDERNGYPALNDTAKIAEQKLHIEKSSREEPGCINLDYTFLPSRGTYPLECSAAIYPAETGIALESHIRFGGYNLIGCRAAIACDDRDIIIPDTVQEIPIVGFLRGDYPVSWESMSAEFQNILFQLYVFVPDEYRELLFGDQIF